MILGAAEALIAERGPDAVGLKAVAERAEVSHALVTHYFGTYEGLVQRVLQRRVERARAEALERVMQAPPGPEGTLEVLLGLVKDPAHVRLMTWAFLSSRSKSLVPFEPNDLRMLVDAIVARRLAVFGPAHAGTPEEVEFVVTLTLSAGYGFALGREAFARALGDRALSYDGFFKRMAELIRLYTGLPAPA